MAKSIIIGVGNLLFCDDGVGIIAIDYLKQNFKFEPNIELLDGGTLGFNLIEYFLEYDNVFIVDTISIDDEVGTIYKIPSQELLGGGSYKKTAHEVEVVEMLEAAQFYENQAKVSIFGIIPKDIISVKIGLSDDLIEKFDRFIQTILDELQELNIEVTRVGERSIKSIIKDLTTTI